MSALWKRTRNYLSSHSNFFIVTGGIIGGAYLLTQYAVSTFQQIQEKLVQDKGAKENLRRRFAQNQEDCTFTVLALLPTVGDQLFGKLNVEQLTETLRAQSSVTKNQAQQPNLQTQPDVTPSQEPQEQQAAHSDESNGLPSSIQHNSDAEPLTAEQAEPIQSEETLAPIQPDAPPKTTVLPPQSSSETALDPTAKPFVPSFKQAVPANASPEQHVETEPVQESLASQQVDKADSAPPASDQPTDKPSEQEQTNAQPILHASESDELTQTPTLIATNRESLIAERQAKLRLWNELKIVAFSRTVTSLYCAALLTLQTHIQLNLIGRFAYLASIETQASSEQGANPLAALDADLAASSEAKDSLLGLDHNTERLYLTFSWWFLHKGWEQLSDKIVRSIEKTFASLPVKAQISLADLRSLMNEARELVEHELSASSSADLSVQDHASAGWKRSNFLTTLFPSSEDEEIDVLVKAGAATAEEAARVLQRGSRLRSLLDETKDIIESPDFLSLSKLCLDRVFEVFFNTMAPTFGLPPSTDLLNVTPLGEGGPRFQELPGEGRRIRLATLFPAVARQSQLAIHGVPNEYIESLADTKELRAFSAIIYSAWPQA